MNARSIVFGSIVVSVVAAGVLYRARYLSASILPADNGSHTTDMRAVKLTIENKLVQRRVVFEVPAAYLTRASHRDGGVVESFVIETGLPDLIPRPYQFGSSKADSGTATPQATLAQRNGLRIRVGGPAYPHAGYATTDFGPLRARLQTTTHVEPVPEGEYGLMKFADITCGSTPPPRPPGVPDTYSACTPSDNNHYVNLPNETPSIQIDCPRTPRIVEGCQAITYCEGIFIRFIFHATEIARWREFQAGACGLIQRFIAEDIDTRASPS
jgi:hypothetical protein